MKQAATDTAYITFMRALVNMTALQPQFLSHVVTKIGLVNVVNNLNKSQPHLQVSARQHYTSHKNNCHAKVCRA